MSLLVAALFLVPIIALAIYLVQPWYDTKANLYRKPVSDWLFNRVEG